MSNQFKAVRSPCQKCWKRPGEGWNGLHLCYKCSSDFQQLLNFAGSRGWKIMVEMEDGLVTLVGENLPQNGGG